HMVVAVAAHLIANAVQHQGAIAERLQGLQALLQRNQLALAVRPERRGHNPVGTEQDHQPLLAPLLIGEAEAGEIQNEREGRRANPQVADELASISLLVHGTSPRYFYRTNSQFLHKETRKPGNQEEEPNALICSGAFSCFRSE